MESVILFVFVIGYLLIALEHPVKINKTATALVTGVLCWTLFVVSEPGQQLLTSESYLNAIEKIKSEVAGGALLSATELHTEYVSESLEHHLAEIAQILFFLMGAMTIVELIDAHHGFRFITNMIKTRNPVRLLWIVCVVTFFLSAVLDNLTTTIVMISLIRKLIPNKETRLFFAGMIIVSANAGGAWSPIGDVTTTMLWIGGQISAGKIIVSLILPSIVCMVVPLIYLSLTMKSEIGTLPATSTEQDVHPGSGKLMLVLGIAALTGVPIFKTVTHLPPYLGMLLGLGVLWIVSELINPDLDESIKKQYTAAHALGKIDMPSVLFFLGILLAVSALQSMSMLSGFSAWLDATLKDNRVIISLIGVLSSIVDNVPLVAASMGMYSMEQYPVDSMAWHYLAYCAGTGGSLLVIGSAAGVAAMGMEKIEFIWFLKKITWLAAIGYIAGALVYLGTYA